LKSLLQAEGLDNFPHPKFTGLSHVISEFDGTSAWVHPSVVKDFLEKGASVLKDTAKKEFTH
jgi:hypothetical protein